MADFYNGPVRGLAAFFDPAPSVPALTIYSGDVPTFVFLNWGDGTTTNCTHDGQFRIKVLCEGECAAQFRVRQQGLLTDFRPGQQKTLSFTAGDEVSIRLRNGTGDQYRAVFDWYYEDDLIDRMYIEVATTDLNRPPGGVFDQSRFARLLADEPELSNRVFRRTVPLEPGPVPTAQQDLLYFHAVDVTDRDGEVFSFIEGSDQFVHPTTGRRYTGGVLAEFSGAQQNADLSPNEMTIALSGIQRELSFLARFDDYQYAEVKVWMFALNQRAQQLTGEWLRYRGFVSHAEFTQDEDRKSVSIVFFLTTRVSDPDRQLIPRLTPAYQKQIDPTDTAFDKLVEQAGKELTWGRSEIRGYPESAKNY